MKSLTGGARPIYDPNADRQRFLVLVLVENDCPQSTRLIHNWRP